MLAKGVRLGWSGSHEAVSGEAGPVQFDHLAGTRYSPMRVLVVG